MEFFQNLLCWWTLWLLLSRPQIVRNHFLVQLPKKQQDMEQPFGWFQWILKCQSSNYLISLIWIKSCRYSCLPNFVIIGLIDMAMSILISTLTWKSWKKLNSLLQSAILQDFLNHEYQFTFPKSQIQLAENRDGEEHRQLQSALRLMQMQSIGSLNNRFKIYSCLDWFVKSLSPQKSQNIFWKLSVMESSFDQVMC